MDYSKAIRPLMGEERYLHSLAVAEQAVRLAKIHGEDEQKAYTAGILHDICKDMNHSLQLQWIENSDIIFSDSLRSRPELWHGFAGSVYIQKELSVTDADIINAVRYHTTARAQMSKLEKITYIADLTSDDRIYGDVDIMRALANTDLDAAMKEALNFIYHYLKKSNIPICPYTYAACTEYGVCGNGGNDRDEIKSD